MFIEPRIQVNPVIDQPTPKTEVWHPQLNEKRCTNAQILSCLILGKAAYGRQRQDGLFHHMPCCAR